MYILIDNYSCGIHPLGDRPLDAIVELIKYLSGREDQVTCNPETWHLIVSHAIKENFITGTESELFKMVESLSTTAFELTRSKKRDFEIHVIQHEGVRMIPSRSAHQRVIDFLHGKSNGVTVDELKRKFSDHRDVMDNVVHALYEGGLIERITYPSPASGQPKTAYRLADLDAE